jgi:hypothetical protein
VLTIVQSIYTPHPQMNPAMYYVQSSPSGPTATVHASR